MSVTDRSAIDPVTGEGITSQRLWNSDLASATERPLRRSFSS